MGRYRKSRRERMVPLWESRWPFEEVLWKIIDDAIADGGLSNVVLRKLGVEPWDRKLFLDWYKNRPPVTELTRHNTAHHEAGHAVTAEILIPGHVVEARCFWEIRESRPGRYMVGQVEYDKSKDAPQAPTAILALYLTAYTLAGPYFHKMCCPETPKETLDARADQDMDYIRRNFEIWGMTRQERAEFTGAAFDILNRLNSSDAVSRAVRAVAQSLISDVCVPGVKIRSIIRAGLDPAQLLATVGLPPWNAGKEEMPKLYRRSFDADREIRIAA